MPAKNAVFEACQLCVAGNQAREGKGKVVEKPQDARVPFQPQLGVTQVLVKVRFRFGLKPSTWCWNS